MGMSILAGIFGGARLSPIADQGLPVLLSQEIACGMRRLRLRQWLRLSQSGDSKDSIYMGVNAGCPCKLSPFADSFVQLAQVRTRIRKQAARATP
jgi:hypothetical protein